MRINRLSVRNFRGIRDLTVTFGQTNVALFSGVNGSGKTGILDAIAILLSRLTERIRLSSGKGGRQFVETDISNDAGECLAEIEVDFMGETAAWSLSRGRTQYKKTFAGEEHQIKRLVSTARKKMEQDRLLGLPTAMYYPTNRAVLDIPLRIRTQHQFDRESTYEESLSAGSIQFRVFFEWFRKLEDLENETRISNPAHRDHRLEAVRESIYSLLEGFSDLRIRRSPLRMEIQKHGQTVVINQLSDGEKCLLALTGDIARRMAIANPAPGTQKTGSGIILIDEVDLHLHPGWQRKIIDALRRAFPNVQFILATHSPQVMSSVKHEELYIMDYDESGITCRRASIRPFGRDSNQILEVIMDVPERPASVRQQLRRYFELITEGNTAEAEKLGSELSELLGPDEPKLARAQAFIRQKKAYDS